MTPENPDGGVAHRRASRDVVPTAAVRMTHEVCGGRAPPQNAARMVSGDSLSGPISLKSSHVFITEAKPSAVSSLGRADWPY